MSQVSDTEVLNALEQILVSKTFIQSERLKAFLGFIVTETLAGRSHTLKAYTIAVEVFGRNEDFDPQLDAIVRVQAKNLRQRLQRYYLTEGKDDLLVIEVPSGGYIPEFRRAAPDSSPRPRDNRSGRLRLSILTLMIYNPTVTVVLLASTTLLAALLIWRAVSPDAAPLASTREISASMRLDDPTQIPAGPSIAVLSFKNSLVGEPLDAAILQGLSIEIISDLSRFRELFVLGPATASRFQDGKDAHEFGAQYVLSGSVDRHDSQIHVRAHLEEAATGRVLWSQDFQRSLTAENALQVQHEIARSVALAVGQPWGIINRWEARKVANRAGVALNSYECFMGYYAYAENESEDAHLEMRDCLEQAVERNPGYARAWAALSWFYGDEIRHGYNPRPASAERAVTAARKAVNLDPNDAFNHEFLADAYMTRGDKDLATRHFTQAIELNPNDSDVLADAAWHFSLLGEWDKAEGLIKKAMALNPGHPPWYHLATFYISLSRHDYATAYDEAKAMLRPGNNQAQLLLTSAAALAGRDDEARKQAGILRQKFPEMAADPRSALRRMLVSETILDELMRGLDKALIVVTGEKEAGDGM